MNMEGEEFSEDLDRLSFPAKVRLAQAMCLIGEAEGLMQLNRTRNCLAHSPMFEVDTTAALQIADAVARDFSDPGSPWEIEFSLDAEDRRSPVDALRLSVITLFRYLLQATGDLQRMKSATVERQVRALTEMGQRLGFIVADEE